MSELTDDAPLSNSTGGDSQPSTGGAASDLSPISQNQETEPMEVHHHAHHSGPKNWKSHLWEFLMLFLAVFCGFLAEYQLEHTIEHQREKQYIRSLIADLKTDQEVLSKHVNHLKRGISMMDSMINILNVPSQIAGNTGSLYYLARVGPRLTPLSNNNRTYEQLKNSGNFRLIGNLNVSNKIMAYYEKFPLMRLLEQITENEFTEYKKIAAKILDPAILKSMEGENSEIRRISTNPLLVSNNSDLLRELSVFSVYLHGTKKGMLARDMELQVAGAELISYLQNEYDFK